MVKTCSKVDLYFLVLRMRPYKPQLVNPPVYLIVHQSVTVCKEHATYSDWPCYSLTHKTKILIIFLRACISQFLFWFSTRLFSVASNCISRSASWLVHLSVCWSVGLSVRRWRLGARNFWRLALLVLRVNWTLFFITGILLKSKVPLPGLHVPILCQAK